MTKKQLQKTLSELYMTLHDTIDNIECRLEVIDSKDNPTEQDEQDNDILNDMLELIKELTDKIEEV